MRRRLRPSVEFLESRLPTDGDTTMAAPGPDPEPDFPDGMTFSPDPAPGPGPDPYTSGPQGDEPSWIDYVLTHTTDPDYVAPVPGPGPVSPY